ncbi:MAG: hypothetical protein PUF72_08215 [Clostridiales bacterium]|nr:hypothetical protein [Clostridiales bacterium]
MKNVFGTAMPIILAAQIILHRSGNFMVAHKSKYIGTLRLNVVKNL